MSTYTLIIEHDEKNDESIPRIVSAKKHGRIRTRLGSLWRGLTVRPSMVRGTEPVLDAPLAMTYTTGTRLLQSKNALTEAFQRLRVLTTHADRMRMRSASVSHGVEG